MLLTGVRVGEIIGESTLFYQCNFFSSRTIYVGTTKIMLDWSWSAFLDRSMSYFDLGRFRENSHYVDELILVWERTSQYKCKLCSNFHSSFNPMSTLFFLLVATQWVYGHPTHLYCTEHYTLYCTVHCTVLYTVQYPTVYYTLPRQASTNAIYVLIYF